MNNIFISESKSADENIEIFNGAIASLRESGGGTLTIAPGVYEISSPRARETQKDIMTSKYGENAESTVFKPDFPYSKGLDISGLKNTTIEGYGVTLLVDGFMEPVSITNCENVTLKGLIIDHKRKPYSKGMIKETVFTDGERKSGYITVEFGSDYPLDKSSPMPRSCVFDTHANRFSLYGELKIETDRRKELSSQLWSFPCSNLAEDVSGKELYIWHTFHSRPAILIENSRNTRLSRIIIHSQPGMGVVAHRCENLYFDRLRVEPSAGEHMSTNTDATHITSCRGTVEYNNCRFDGQGDDAVNVHTYYHKIVKTGEKSCRIVLDAPTGTHSQTADYPEAGDRLELTDEGSLACVDTYRVVSCKNLDFRTSELVLDKPLPENCEDYYFADTDSLPDFYFHDCICHSNLARGVLTKTKYVRIEDNEFFDVVGTAINVTAEAYWREGVGTSERVIIRRNRISFCGRTNAIRQSNCAGITIALCATSPFAPVHSDVIITDNIIDCPQSPHGIYVSNTKQLTLARNSIISAETPVVTEDFSEPDI